MARSSVVTGLGWLRAWPADRSPRSVQTVAPDADRMTVLSRCRRRERMADGIEGGDGMLSEEHRAAVEFAAEAGRALMELRDRSEPGKALGQGGRPALPPSAHGPAGRTVPRRPDPVGGGRASPSTWTARRGGSGSSIPLDGTREYSEGREDWAVHVALAVDGEPRVGAVALPAMGVVLGNRGPAAARRAGRGAAAGGQPEPPTGVRSLRRRAAGGDHRAHGVGRRQDRRRHPRGGRGLRPRRRPVRMGFGCAGGRGAGQRAPRQPARRLAPALLATRPVAARSGGLPSDADRGGDGRAARVGRAAADESDCGDGDAGRDGADGEGGQRCPASGRVRPGPARARSP